MGEMKLIISWCIPHYETACVHLRINNVNNCCKYLLYTKAWHKTGNKPLHKPMMTKFSDAICRSLGIGVLICNPFA